MVNGIYEKMLTALNENARRTGDGAEQDKLFTKGEFAGKNLRQAMESSRRANLDQLVDFIQAKSIDFAGKSWNLDRVFSFWVKFTAEE